MPFQIIRNDITKMNVDAIVSGGNGALENRGGVSGRIFDAAGPRLSEECRKLDGCAPGEAIVTPGYRLAAKYIIHTVGPKWRGGHSGEEHTLRLCYRNVLNAAKENDCNSIAFPLIATGAYHYPKAKAIDVAFSEISRFLSDNDSDMSVYLVLFSDEAFLEGKSRFPDLREFIDSRYVGEQSFSRRRESDKELPSWAPDAMQAPMFSKEDIKDSRCLSTEAAPSNENRILTELNLDNILGVKDKPFKDLLLDHINASGMTNSEVYHKANISKQVYSNVFNRAGYTPSKTTILGLAISLKLNIDQTVDLLRSNGMALSHAFIGDIIVEYFINTKCFDVMLVNEALFEYEAPLIGSQM